MNKTLEEIKKEVAKEYIKSGERSTMEQLMTEVAERYAQSQTQELVSVIKDLIPIAEDGYRLHKSNGSHQDFLEDDRAILKTAKELLTKYQKP